MRTFFRELWTPILINSFVDGSDRSWSMKKSFLFNRCSFIGVMFKVLSRLVDLLRLFTQLFMKFDSKDVSSFFYRISRHFDALEAYNWNALFFEFQVRVRVREFEK